MSDYEFSPYDVSDYEGPEDLNAENSPNEDEQVPSEDDMPVALAPNASPIYQRTQSLGMALSGQSLCQKVIKVLDTMEREGIDMPIFLDAISWGDAECITNDKVRYARTALMGSRQLPGILKRWYNPPRSKSKGQRAKGGHDHMEKFAIDCIAEKIQKEMDGAADMFKIPETHIVEENLLSLHLHELKLQARDEMPVFWSFLESVTKKKRSKSIDNADGAVVCSMIKP